jgi:isopenicillin N synthase-like dioxygenase
MTSEQYTHIELLTLSGPEYRRVSTALPRLPTADEIPIIDLTAIDGDLNTRKQLAAEIRAASQSTGFFYVRNHGIPESLINDALSQSQAFFAQAEAEKEKVFFHRLSSANGYHGLGTTQINQTESKGLS